MATYYMSPTGNDSTGTGTQANPYLTVVKCISVASANDTIYLLAGTYNSTHWPLASRPTVNFAINFVGAGVGQTIVDWTGEVLWDYYGFLNTTFSFSLTGIQFQNIASSHDAYYCTLQMAFMGGGLTINVIDCLFQNFNTGAAFAGNQLFGCGSTNTSLLTGVTINIIGTVFKNIATSLAYSESGMFSIGGTGNTFNFFKNVIYLETVGGGGAQYIFARQNGNSVLNIKDCIVYNNQGSSSPFLTGAGTGNTINFNNNDTYGTFSALPTGAGNITTNPLFVDIPSNNFHLQATSPCRNAGGII